MRTVGETIDKMLGFAIPEPRIRPVSPSRPRLYKAVHAIPLWVTGAVGLAGVAAICYYLYHVFDSLYLSQGNSLKHYCSVTNKATDGCFIYGYLSAGTVVGLTAAAVLCILLTAVQALLYLQRALRGEYAGGFYDFLVFLLVWFVGLMVGLWIISMIVVYEFHGWMPSPPEIPASPPAATFPRLPVDQRA